MSQSPHALLKTNLKTLRLPRISAEFETLARDAATGNQSYEEYLLKLTELEVATRAANALASRIRQANFPVEKELSDFDFSLLPALNKQKVLELGRSEWVRAAGNCCLIGEPGTGKTHLAVGLGLCAARSGWKVKFFTAGQLVTKLEEAQQAYQLDRLLGQLDRADLLICDELGYVSFNRTGAELLFQIFADRYERKSLLLTSNLPFSEWVQIFQGERMTAALLDRLTHHCEILEMNGESYRFRESMKEKKTSNKKSSSQ
jgi:DNA replication protein DnaC